MPDPTKDTEGKTDTGTGKAEGGAEEMIPRSEVQRLIAKELAKQGRELGEKLTAKEKESQEKGQRLTDLETQLTDLHGKAGTEAERERIRLGAQIKKLGDELAEERKTRAAIQTRADSDAIDAIASQLAADATRGRGRVKTLLASQLRRKPDGKVVWVDPETDEEREPKDGLAAFQKSDPYFWEPPQTGSGASAGAPPVAGKKPLTGMSKAELAALYDKETGD